MRETKIKLKKTLQLFQNLKEIAIFHERTNKEDFCGSSSMFCHFQLPGLSSPISKARNPSAALTSLATS
jgi:hypothetical protein